MARLETILRAQLFHRTTRKIALTEEGKHLLQYAELIMKTSQDAAMSMKELIKEFKEKLPNIKVEIESSNVKRNLINDGYDFALRAMDETNPELIARYIGHIKDVIVASPEYVKRMKLKGVDPQELKTVPVILSSLKESWNTWKLQKGSKDIVLEVQGNYASTSYQTNRQMSLARLGVARVPFYLVERDLAEKRLAHLYKEYSIATHPLYLVYPSKGYRSRRNKAARDLIWWWMKERKEMVV